MANQVKSPNIQQLEQFVQPGCIITLNSNNQYLLKKILGFGNFGITFYSVALSNQAPVAIKIQSEDRGQLETSIFDKIRNEYQNHLVRFWETGEIIRVKNALGQYASNLTINYQRLDNERIRNEINNQNPDVIAALTILQSQTGEAQAQKADAWQKLVSMGVLVSHVKKLTGIVMEFVDGAPLDKVYHQKTDIFSASRIIQEIITAIECLHRHKLIHGDLKPENIIIDKSGHVKVLDFSTSKVEGTINPNIATSSYAPFLQRTRGEVNRYSDIFSIGAIFYRMVTGKEPTVDYFYGLREGNNTEALVTAHVRKHFESFNQIPNEQKNVLARIFSPEINSIPSIVSSEYELQSLMARHKPSSSIGFEQPLATVPGQVKNIVIDYVPNNVLTTFRNKRHASYLQVSELARDFRIIKTRAFIRNVWTKFEIASQTLTLIIAVYALLTSISLTRNLIPTFSAPMSTPNVSVPATEVLKSLEILQQEADYHFDKAIEAHNAGINATDPNAEKQNYQTAFAEYEKAVEIYHNILDRREELDQYEIGETNTSLGITRTNQAILYLGMDEKNNAILKSLEALEYLDLGYDLNPNSFSLDKLILCKYILGYVYISDGNYDNGLYYYEEVAYHLSDPYLESQDMEDYKAFLLESLTEIEYEQLSADQQTRIDNLIILINNL